MAREAMNLCLRVLKESNKSRFDSCSVRNSVLIISHITFRDCRLHIFSDNLFRNSCILKNENSSHMQSQTASAPQIVHRVPDERGVRGSSPRKGIFVFFFIRPLFSRLFFFLLLSIARFFPCQTLDKL